MSSYTREVIEELVPTIWDRHYAWGMVNERPADIDMPRAPRGKTNNHNTLWAHLADIRVAWAHTPLTQQEAQALVLCGGLGLNTVVAGVILGVSKQAVQQRYDRGVGKLADYLNGTDYNADEIEP